MYRRKALSCMLIIPTLPPQPRSQRAATQATEGSTYAKLYIDLLRKLQKVDTVQWVLVAIANMLSGEFLPLTMGIRQLLTGKGRVEHPFTVSRKLEQRDIPGSAQMLDAER
jgi:hypothetical protein